MKIITQKYKPYPLLRAFVVANNFSIDQVARKLQMSRSYYLARINGHSEWTLQDIHKIMALMNEPPERMGEFFPPGGRYD